MAQPTRPGTFKPGNDARAAANRSHASRRARVSGETTATVRRNPPQAEPHATPQADPTYGARLGVTPDAFTDAARVVGLERAAVPAPPAARIELERIAPVWAAGYLEKVTPAQVARFGDMREYLRQVWGGGLYDVRVLDHQLKGAWQSEQVSIAGPTRYQGTEVAPPVATPSPALASPTSPVGDLAGSLAGLVDELRSLPDAIAERIAAGPTSATVAATPPPSVAATVPTNTGDQVAEALERWQAASARIESAVARLAGARQRRQEADGDDDDDETPEQNPQPTGPRAVADRYLERWLESVLPMPQPPKVEGMIATVRVAAPQGTAPPAEPVAAERIPE